MPKRPPALLKRSSKTKVDIETGVLTVLIVGSSKIFYVFFREKFFPVEMAVRIPYLILLPSNYL